MYRFHFFRVREEVVHIICNSMVGLYIINTIVVGSISVDGGR